MNTDLQKNKKQKDIFIILLISVPLFFLLFVETISRNNFVAVLEWITANPIIFLYNYLLYLMLFLILQSIFNRLIISIPLYATIFIIYAFANINKRSVHALYITPKDIKMQSNPGNFYKLMIQYVPAQHLFLAIAILVVCTLIVILLKNKYSMKYYTRIITLCLSSLIFIIGSNTLAIAETPVNRIIKFEKYAPWTPNSNFILNGMLCGFLGYTHLNPSKQLLPENYSTEDMNRISNHINSYEQKNDVNTSAPDKIIVILSESFMDVTQLENVTYGIDPLKDIRPDIIGNAVAGVVAGRTANTEFEILTGLSPYPFLADAVPYVDIYQDIPSLPNYFKEQGYQTIALHNYYNNWYRRNEVYDYLGINEFIDEKDFPQEMKGFYLSDEVMAEKIIEVTDSADKQFIFAITMQNHSPYTKDKYQEKDYHPDLELVSPLSKEDEAMLLNYVQGICDANSMYKKLKEHYEGQDENVVILFFGDHTPLFPENGKIFRDLGLYNDKYDCNSRIVPIALWSNYLPEAKKLETPVSFNYLGNVLSEYCGLKQSSFLNYTASLRESFPVVTTDFVFDADGNQYSHEDEEIYFVLQDYFKLCYDFVYGKGYADKKIFE